MSDTTQNLLRLNAKKIHGRAMNVVADFLRQTLTVPNIYIEPRIGRSRSMDVLAIDRAGTGDTHAVEIKTVVVPRSKAHLRELVEQMKHFPFHYKYLALPNFLADFSNSLAFTRHSDLFDESGIGRIGILSFDPSILRAHSIDERPLVSLVVKPERFRIPSEAAVNIEKFISKSRPDIEVRL